MGTKPEALTVKRETLTRRAPVDWRRYAVHAHRARKGLPRDEHPVLVSLAVSLVFALAGLALLQLVGVGFAAGLRDIGGVFANAIPRSREVELVLTEQAVNVSAAPVLDALPDFTKENKIALGGKVPAFALRPERRITIDLNGQLVTTVAIASDGRFGPTPLTLPDGTSTVKATLVEGTTEIASTSQSIVIDRVPPALSIVRPKAGDTVEGPDVVIEGKTEPGADVSVNDRALRPNPDGSFTERIPSVPVGPLAITVLAKDKAGNETKAQLSITVKAPTQTTVAGTVLGVALDRTTVRPGETVVAQVLALDNGKPKADLAVTLQVGVITIGTYKTDASGTARIGFAAPDHEVSAVAVIVTAGGTSASTTLTVAVPGTPKP